MSSVVFRRKHPLRTVFIVTFFTTLYISFGYRIGYNKGYVKATEKCVEFFSQEESVRNNTDSVAILYDSILDEKAIESVYYFQQY